MIQQCQSLFGSLRKSLDVLSVIHDQKPSARIMMEGSEKDKYMDFFSSHGLCVDISSFKVLKQDSKSTLYSDRAIQIPSHDPRPGHFFVYLSKQEETVEEMKKAESKHDHTALGQLLGYPPCCCDFFSKQFSQHNTDLTLDVFEASKGFEFPFQLNITSRHIDISLLSHFPHSFDCSESLEMANNQLSFISSLSPELGGLFSRYLKGVVVYTDMLGMYFMNDYSRKDNEIAYTKVITTSTNKLSQLLQASKKFSIIDKHRILVGGQEVGGAGFGCMVFT